MSDVTEPEETPGAGKQDDAEVEAHSVRKLQGMEAENDRIEEPGAGSTVSVAVCA